MWLKVRADVALSPKFTTIYELSHNSKERGGTQFRKPCDIAFRIMQRRWGIPFEQMVYVGDNEIKDFQAPRQLGMRWIHFMNEDGVYFKSSEKTTNGVGCMKELIEKMEDFVK